MKSLTLDIRRHVKLHPAVYVHDVHKIFSTDATVTVTYACSLAKGFFYSASKQTAVLATVDLSVRSSVCLSVCPSRSGVFSKGIRS